MAPKPQQPPRPDKPKPASARPNVDNVMLHLSHSGDTEKETD